ncbi:methyltransferase domain-containing protein [Bradyrhizobium sp. ISRA443]|uniref:class I SAM-dependent methyltransferase n=1 Tax=unclassified Bradyrhizobium TaxID=2631580 RepID=UPI00247AD860|nr:MULTISPECIES: methyltransferase domain-containing protein [unclassified Bradyrhizobium]WGR99945.1 methyltransferase domain-containing protein [Bradyrhizobium sp. ISRA436]WGS06836.1 methyltransferase domain-containing protein [Bradyrhizobium sp. ISRA437]WGS13718.1 methyltransferase domain-containing protein [Bradyrhizobium sp. ISRA443]
MQHGEQIGHLPFSDPTRWDKMATTYEAQSQPFTAHFAEAAVATLAIGPSSKVLDVATGTGVAALAAARTGAQVTAIDFSAGMIERVRVHGVANIEARQMDGQALDLPDAAFDAVTSVFGVMLFVDWRAGLREMARVTRPGGSAAIAVWKSPDGAAVHLMVSRIIRTLYPDLAGQSPATGLAELADPGRLAAAVIAAGFSDPTITEVSHDFSLNVGDYQGADRLFEFGPQWQALNEAQRAAVAREFRVQVERGRVGDIFLIPSTALIATARRQPS